MSGVFSSYFYRKPLLSWAFLVGVWCGAGKSVRIPFPFGQVSSPSHILIAVFLKCLFKKSPALDKLLYLWGKGELSPSALYSESGIWTC